MITLSANNDHLQCLSGRTDFTGVGAYGHTAIYFDYGTIDLSLIKPDIHVYPYKKYILKTAKNKNTDIKKKPYFNYHSQPNEYFLIQNFTLDWQISWKIVQMNYKQNCRNPIIIHKTFEYDTSFELFIEHVHVQWILHSGLIQ